jgi:GNAT superfamily N-acetyltransferase
VSTQIAVRSGDASELEALLAQRIYEYNAAATGCHDAESFSAARTNAAGEVEAGVYGYTWCGCCYVTYLWVAEAVRGKGIGTELLEAVERYARENTFFAKRLPAEPRESA